MNKIPIYLYPWALIVFIIGNLYRFTFQAIFNIIGNGLKYIKIIFTGKYFKIRKEVKEKLKSIKTLKDLFIQYEQFIYKYDGLFNNAKGFFKVFNKFPTWTTTYTVLHYLNYKGNCQDACILARKLIKAYNKNSEKTLKEKIKIYIPLNIKALFYNIHYINIVIDKSEYTFSSGVIRRENKKAVAVRQLKNKSKYWIWIK